MEPLSIDPKSTALVLIDLQNAIMGIEGTPRSPKEVLAASIRLADACRKAGSPVFLVRVEIGEFQQVVADAQSRMTGTPPPIASQLVAEIGPVPGDIVIVKKQWGAFYGTELELQLRRRHIRTVILGGVATNFGVESTARVAMELGFELLFPEDAMTSIGPDAHAFAMKAIFPRMGRIRSTAEILAAFPK